MIYTQKQKLDIKYGNHRWNIKSGATRSGKTYIDIDFKIVDRILERKNKSGIAIICGNNYGTIERNIIIPLREQYHHLIGNITSNSKNKSTHIMIAGEPVYLFGAGDSSKIDSLRGVSVKYAYCDEAVTYNKDFFEMLKSRLDKEYSVCDLTCNPDSPHHWFKEFIDSDIDKWILHFTIDDNPFLPPSFVEQLKREYYGTVYYDRYILGLWVNAEGIIFLQFANNKKKYCIDKAENILKIDIGVDFGGNKSKTMFIASGIVREIENINGILKEKYKIVVLEEHYVQERNKGAGIDAEQVAREHYEFYKKIIEKYNIIPLVSWCDHFDLAIIQMRNYHKSKGSNHNIDKVNKTTISLSEYISTINALLNIEKLLILKHNERVIESLSTLLYDEDSEKDTVLDDGTCDVDTYDAFRYSISRFLLQNNLYHWTLNK